MRHYNLYLPLLLLALSTHSTSIQAQDTDERNVGGNMECKVTGQQVIQSEEGKSVEYSTMNGLETGETIRLRYGVKIELSSEYAHAFMSLGGLLVQSSSIFSEHYGDEDSFDLYEMSRGIIAAEDFLEFFNQKMHARLERYYKNDWYGIVTDYREDSLVRRTLTVDCRQGENNWDAFRRDASTAFESYTD